MLIGAGILIVCLFRLDSERDAEDATYSHRVRLNLCEIRDIKGNEFNSQASNQNFKTSTSFASLVTDS